MFAFAGFLGGSAFIYTIICPTQQVQDTRGEPEEEAETKLCSVECGVRRQNLYDTARLSRVSPSSRLRLKRIISYL